MAFVLFFSFASGVNAGFFSLFRELFENSEEKISSGGNNSQTIALLGSLISQENYFVGQGGGELNIEENALVSQGGSLVGAKSNRISLYTVREGDTLGGIADLFNVSVNTIFWANNLTSKNKIQPGQTLVILPVSGIHYEIKKGDTIEKIAKKFGADADEIIVFNNLSAGDNLAAGETIIIPDAELPESAPTKTLADSRSAEDYAKNSGYYLRPISGGKKSQGLHGLNGVDLATFCGEPIFSSASGDVVLARPAGWNSGYGKYLAINHPNGTQTLYAHLSSVLVSAGWHVVKGQTIGFIGSTGKSTGCHLHFEIRGAKNPF